MKKNIKKYSVFTLLIMLCNFFMPIISYASTPNLLESMISAIDDNIFQIDNKFEDIKTNDSNYTTDEQYKKVIDEYEVLINDYTTEYKEIKEILKQGISLNEVLEQESISIVLDPDYTITNFNIDTLPTEVSTTYTNDDIYQYIYNQYFKTYGDNIESYFNSFTNGDLDDIVNDYKNDCNNIDLIISNIDTYKGNIETYKTNEELLGNNVDLIVDDKDIRDLLDEYVLELTNLKTSMNSLDSSNSTTIQELSDEIDNKYQEYLDNNQDWITSGLKQDIDDLVTIYSDNDTVIETDDNLSNIIDSYIINIENEADYQDIMTRVEKYLSIKVTDTDTINSYLETLNNLRDKYLEEKAFNNIKNNYFTDNVLNSLDNLKILSKLTVLNMPEELKEELFNNIINFIGYKLNDETKYAMNINYKNIVLYNVLEELDITEFKNNFIQYLIEDDSNIPVNYIYTQSNDLAYILINENYKINLIINGDLNDNKYLDNEDLEILINIYTNHEENEYDMDLIDINQNGNFDISDVLELANTLNIINYNEEEISSNYEIISSEDDNNIYYEIYLKTNGIVNAIEFNFNYSNDLEIISYETNHDLTINYSENALNVFGIGNYQDQTLLLKITTKKVLDSTTTNVSIKGNIYGLNNIYNLSTINTISRETLEEEIKEEPKTEITTLNNIVEEKEEIKQEENNEKTEITTSDSDDNNSIIWGSVIKVVIVVLLGTLIIYFLNKNEDEEFLKNENNNNKK